MCVDDKEEHRRQEFVDHQAEVAGISIGRQERFFTGESSPRGRRANEQRARDRAFRTQLDLLLSDPTYAAAHTRANDLADTAQEQLNAMLEKVAARIEHLETVRADMEDNTAHLPDGTAVFRNADGTLQTADGRPLSEPETASLLNPENLLSYERYKDMQDALQGARTRQDDLCGVQGDLNHARRRLNDPENPAKLDEIPGIEDDIRTMVDKMKTYEAAAPKFNTASTAEVDSVVDELDFSAPTSAP